MEGVSVVVPNFNAAKYLPACLESILQQEYPGPVEILVGDDGSTDDSRDVAARYAPAVRLLQHPGGVNRGLPATRNLCLEAATQPLIAFLDSDDLWLPGHLLGLGQALAEQPDAALAYNNGSYLLNDGRIGGERFPPGHHTLTAERLLLDCSLTVNGILVRRAVLEAVGRFDANLRYAEDHDLWLRILERYPAVYVPHKGWLYRRHEGQMSRTKTLWQFAQKTLEKARQRGHYPGHLLRKRQAVIDYRLGVAALSEGQYLQAGWHFTRAAWNDPVRSVKELTKHALRR